MELHHDTESDLEKALLQHADYISQVLFIYLFLGHFYLGLAHLWVFAAMVLLFPVGFPEVM